MEDKAGAAAEQGCHKEGGGDEQAGEGDEGGFQGALRSEKQADHGEKADDKIGVQHRRENGLIKRSRDEEKQDDSAGDVAGEVAELPKRQQRNEHEDRGGHWGGFDAKAGNLGGGEERCRRQWRSRFRACGCGLRGGRQW